MFIFYLYNILRFVIPQCGAEDTEMSFVRPSVRQRYVVSALRFWFVDQLVSNLHTSIILGISSLSSKLGKIRKQLWEWWPFLRCLPKHIKISKCYNFNEHWYLEDFRPDECDSDKCNLKMAAIVAIMVAILAAMIWSPKHIKNFEVLQCSNYKENLYLERNVIVTNAISK